jgi:Phage integrase family
MAHLFKVKTTKPLPKNAEIVTKDGEKFVRLKRGGRSTLAANQPVFDLRAPGGELRRTSLMMKLDLERARQAWIDEAKKDRKERKRREETDYLQYQDENGLYADFHANRHTFISNLAKSGVSPKVAQTMARHSDINLTMNVYSHVKMEDQEAAIAVLPAPSIIGGTKAKRRSSGL